MGKKLQPKLRFRGFTDAWEQRKGAEVICVRRDNIANPPKDIVDVELENLIEGGGLQGDLSLRTASTSVFHEHDTLFGRLRPYLRKFWFANTSGVKSGEIWSLYSSALKPEFLYALTQSAQFLNQALQTAGTKMPRAEWKTIAEAYFAVPQAEEQEKIGILFQKLEQLIDAEKRKLDLLQKKKTALLLRVFGQKLRFKGYDNPWNRHKLGSITDSYSGGTPPVRDSSYYGGDIPFIRSAEIANESTELFITQSGLAASSAKWVKKGDVLYALYGANSGNTSFAKLDGVINQAVLSIRAKKGFSNSFIMYWLQRSKNAIIGTFLQGGQGNLSGSIVKKLSIQTPRIDEQERIGLFFIKIDSRITAETRKLDLLIDKKKALLQKMFV